MDIKFPFVHINDLVNLIEFTYVIATGSDEMTSRTFSQPNVVIYAIE